jgi:hypothetical protein
MYNYGIRNKICSQCYQLGPWWIWLINKSGGPNSTYTLPLTGPPFEKCFLLVFQANMEDLDNDRRAVQTKLSGSEYFYFEYFYFDRDQGCGHILFVTQNHFNCRMLKSRMAMFCKLPFSLYNILWLRGSRGLWGLFIDLFTRIQLWVRSRSVFNNQIQIW